MPFARRQKISRFLILGQFFPNSNSCRRRRRSLSSRFFLTFLAGLLPSPAFSLRSRMRGRHFERPASQAKPAINFSGTLRSFASRDSTERENEHRHCLSRALLPSSVCVCVFFLLLFSPFLPTDRRAAEEGEECKREEKRAQRD